MADPEGTPVSADMLERGYQNAYWRRDAAADLPLEAWEQSAMSESM